MVLVSSLLASLFAGLAIRPILAQQYAGEAIELDLPARTGSEITFFNIKDRNGENATLVNYFSLPTTTDKRPDPKTLQRVIVVLHGSGRDAWKYFQNVYRALPTATGIDSDVTEENVAILAPWFARPQDVPRVPNNILTWDGYEWSGGANSATPEDRAPVSSFECLDQILMHFDDKSIYPNIKHIVVGGHSRGAQMTHRYIGVGRPLPLTAGLSFWAGNPNAYLWLNSTRPLDPGRCTQYNEWREGIDNYTNEYESEFVAEQGSDGVLARYKSKYVGFARGLRDFGNVNDDCKPESQGNNRGERFFNFVTFFPPNPETATVDYVNTTHNAAKMMRHESGAYRLFLDNWDGEGHRHADVGERQIEGDNPHPVST